MQAREPVKLEEDKTTLFEREYRSWWGQKCFVTHVSVFWELKARQKTSSQPAIFGRQLLVNLLSGVKLLDRCANMAQFWTTRNSKANSGLAGWR